MLRVSGEDAASFLQGQFSNDLSRLGAGQASYGLWLDRRGRVIADSHVVNAGDGGFWVASVTSDSAAVARRLEAFIIADDVAIEDQTQAWMGLSLIGPGTGAWLAGEARPGLRLPGRRALAESWDWIFPAADAAGAVAAVAGARMISAQEAERMRIEDGIPAVPRDIGPGDLPNEGGLEKSAVSYSKGCYLGQEVMARLKTRGTLRRALVRVSGPGTQPGVPAALWCGGRPAGELRSAAGAANGAGFVGIALVPTAFAAPGAELGLAREGPPALEVLRGP